MSISRSDLTVAIQTTGELRLWLLPVACTVERMDLSVAHASGGAAPVGSFQALSPLAVGFGGRVPLHLRGALEVANLTALHELSARIITAPELSLSVAGSVTVRAWPGLASPGLARSCLARPGRAWPGLAVPGQSRPGLARPGPNV